jgi:mannose-6-phosphate isomerase-like protein (cupin superfamily)
VVGVVVAMAAKLPAMPFVDVTELAAVQRLPGWSAQVFHSESMTFAWYDVAPDAVPLHEHRHPQEEVWNVVSGRLAVTVEGSERVIGPGEVAIVPAGAPHSARPAGPCRAIVVDHPTRPDAGRVHRD